MKGADLDVRIPCNRCAIKKGHNCYSKNRLADLKDHIYKTPRFNAATQGFVSCMECSGAGAQQLEIFCIGCELSLSGHSLERKS